jgi:hypothetical protein
VRNAANLSVLGFTSMHALRLLAASEHLDAALDPSREGIRELEAQLNQALKAQLPKRVCRRIKK